MFTVEPESITLRTFCFVWLTKFTIFILVAMRLGLTRVRSAFILVGIRESFGVG